MNHKTCALLISLTSAAALPLASAATADASQLPVLAGSATVTHPTSRVASNISSVRTIPLISDLYPATDDAGSGNVQNLSKTLDVGESEIFEFDKITTTAVGDPTVADITPLSANRLLVSGKGTGETTIFVYDEHGKNTISVTVLPSENMNVLAAKIEDEIGIPTVTVRAVNNTIFLEGSAPTQSAVDLADAIATAYAPNVKNLIVTEEQIHEKNEAERYADLITEHLGQAGITATAFDEQTIILSGKYAEPISAIVQQSVFTDADDTPVVQRDAQPDPLKVLLASLPPELRVINLINFEQGQTRQVLVRAKIIDIDRNSTKNLGINWGTANITEQQVGTTDQVQETLTFQPQPVIFNQTGIPTAGAPGYANDLLGGGPLSRFEPWAAELNALIQENKARVLSQPSLMVLDGNQASMLVGGEFPVPVAQVGEGGAAISVSFKPFGVRLNVAPTVIDDDTIQLTVTPEVSDIDLANAVTLNGFIIPGVDIRRATTTLQMKDGQTLVIGGLYSNQDAKNIAKIPLLSQIPVLGEFFKTTTTTKDERELLVLLEVEIVKPGDLGAMPPSADSLENLSIHKPFIPRKEFDQEFPDLENNPFSHNTEAPQVPVSMPGTSADTSGN